jgi:hypothetical protein
MAARTFVISVLILAAAGYAVTADARGSYRCPDGLIRHDDPRILVLQRCGDPVDVQQTSIFYRAIVAPSAVQTRDERPGERVPLGEAWLDGQEEIWTYNFGPRHFLRQIRFVNGRVRDIEVLRHYGWRDDQ